LGEKRKLIPSYQRGPINLNKLLLRKVNSCQNFSLASNLYSLIIMRSFLINKNLCFYYWLKNRIGKTPALRMANTIERVILVFGREQMDKKYR